MSEKSTLRLVVLRVLVFSLFATLIARLFFMQVVTGSTYKSEGSNLRVRSIVTPAVRGLILDDAGRALVANRTSLVISVDRTTMLSKRAHGPLVLTRLALALHTTYQSLYDRMQLCGNEGRKAAADLLERIALSADPNRQGCNANFGAADHGTSG
jgi:penicillin-binding protein 2